MRGYAQGTEPSLYTPSGGRKYLNAAERRRFNRAVAGTAPDIRLFCLTLALSGARVSEILALTPAAIDLDSCTVAIHTLKRRKSGVVRQVPLPRSFVAELNRVFDIRRRQRDPRDAATRLWRWSRSTAWRKVKAVMARADVIGSAAMPKGLRHGFGINATANLVPQHLIQRWLGHASPRSTAIYCDVCGPDERRLAELMWKASYPALVRRTLDAVLSVYLTIRFNSVLRRGAEACDHAASRIWRWLKRRHNL